MHAFRAIASALVVLPVLVLATIWDSYIDGLQADLSNAIEEASIPTIAQYRARRGFQTLQHMYYSRTGLWRTCGWWNSANGIITVANMAKADPDNEEIQSVVRRMFSETIVRAPKSNPQPGAEDHTFSGSPKYLKTAGTNGDITEYSEGWWEDLGREVEDNRTDAEVQEGVFNTPRAGDWLDGYYDDDLWWALAWISAYDVTSDERYLHLAEDIWRRISRTWPTRCFDGGIYWAVHEKYVNAIANELFFSTAAHLANRAKARDYYTLWAAEALDWFLDSGLINHEGTINDGLDKNCKNNGGNAWSYNQGVIIGGLVELQAALPHYSGQYFALASQIAYAGLNALSDSEGIIHDICEPACSPDGTQFKGIFMRNLQLLHQVAPDPVFADAIQRNAESIWERDRAADGTTIFSVMWSGPYVWPGNASTHASAMDALIAAMAIERKAGRKEDKNDTGKKERLEL